MLKKLAFTAAAALISSSAAAVTDKQISEAISSGYGPFEQEAEIVATIDKSAPYRGDRKVDESDLPGSFKAIVWDEPTDRFAALVEDAEGNLLRISGKAYLTLEIPVPGKRIGAGEVISKSDINLKQVRFDRYASSDTFVKTLKNAVGKETTRFLSPDQPIRSDSLTNPSIIKKNDEVIILFKRGNLHLTSRGRALDDASKGDEVLVSRPSASRPVYGIASGAGVVTISNDGEPH